MFDGMKSPGRNDECWCGSGKKYKKCHLNLDERLQELYEQGEEVPHRSLLKTAADIEGIKKSAAINIGVLDYVAEHIKAGVNTAEIDKWIYAGRPQLRGVSQQRVHVHQRSRLPRHPLRG